jgi:periplasmic divalent cation tolerance protein
MTPYIQVITTVARRDEAERIAVELVSARLAGCVQIVGPIKSVYQWQGAVEAAEEWQCLIKTRQDRFAEVEQAIVRIHPYETPEILAMQVAIGNQKYLEWLEQELGA